MGAWFNGAQPKERVDLDETTLVPIVRDAFIRQVADARALQSVSVGRDLESLAPIELYALIMLEEPVLGWVPGAGSLVEIAERASQSGRDGAHVVVRHGKTDLTEGFFPRVIPPSENLFEETFGFPRDWDAGVPGLVSTATHGVETLLETYAGFRHDDLDLKWPGEAD